MNVKDQYLENISKVNMNQSDESEVFDDLNACISALPNCYAKGYLTAKFEAHNQEDMEELKGDMIVWSEWDIFN